MIMPVDVINIAAGGRKRWYWCWRSGDGGWCRIWSERAAVEVMQDPPAGTAGKHVARSCPPHTLQISAGQIGELCPNAEVIAVVMKNSADITDCIHIVWPVSPHAIEIHRFHTFRT